MLLGDHLDHSVASVVELDATGAAASVIGASYEGCLSLSTARAGTED